MCLGEAPRAGCGLRVCPKGVGVHRGARGTRGRGSGWGLFLLLRSTQFRVCVCGLGWWRCWTGLTVRKFQLAPLIRHEIGRLQVPVYHPPRMGIIQCATKRDDPLLHLLPGKNTLLPLQVKPR